VGVLLLLLLLIAQQLFRERLPKSCGDRGVEPCPAGTVEPLHVEPIHAGVIVNCAGPWAPAVGRVTPLWLHRREASPRGCPLKGREHVPVLVEKYGGFLHEAIKG
jgi:hypothetical protein